MNYFMRDFKFREPPPVDFPIARAILRGTLWALGLFVITFPIAYALWAAYLETKYGVSL